VNQIIKLILNGESRGLDNAFNRAGRSLTTFGNRATAVLSRVGHTIQNVSDRIPGLASVASGAALVMAGKHVIDFDARLARLAIQAGLTQKQTLALKQELMEISKDTYQMPEDLLSGMEQIVEKTGNIELARGSIRDMGIAASATGAEMAAIGAVTSNLNEKLDISKEKMRGAFDILNQQGKAGAFTMKELANLGERLFTSAASFGVKGTEGLRKFGAFIQIARTGTGSSEMATTAVERTVADMLQRASKIKAMTGFSIFDEAASKKEGRHVTKDFDLVLKEIIKRTKGDTVKLRKIFGEESIRAMDAMALSYRKFGDFRLFDEFVKQGGDGTQMMSDFGRWTETATAKMILFRAELNKLIDEDLAGPIELFTKALDVLNKHPIITKGGLYTVLGLAGVAAVIKTFRFFKDAFTPSGKKGMPGTGGIGALGKTPIPVYVVNKTLSMIPETYGAGNQPPGGKVPGGGNKLGFWKAAAFFNLGAAAAVGTSQASSWWLENGGENSYGMGKQVLQGLGPLGAIVGGIYDFTALKDGYFDQPETKNEINLFVSLDSNGRVITENNNRNTTIKVDLNRGTWANPLGAY